MWGKHTGQFLLITLSSGGTCTSQQSHGEPPALPCPAQVCGTNQGLSEEISESPSPLCAGGRGYNIKSLAEPGQCAGTEMGWHRRKPSRARGGTRRAESLSTWICLPGGFGGVLHTGGLKAVFSTLTKLSSSQKSNGLTLQLSAHTFNFNSDKRHQERIQLCKATLVWGGGRCIPTGTCWNISSSPPGSVQTVINLCRAQPSADSLPPRLPLSILQAQKEPGCGESCW